MVLEQGEVRLARTLAQISVLETASAYLQDDVSRPRPPRVEIPVKVAVLHQQVSRQRDDDDGPGVGYSTEVEGIGVPDEVNVVEHQCSGPRLLSRTRKQPGGPTPKTELRATQGRSCRAQPSGVHSRSVATQQRDDRHLAEGHGQAARQVVLVLSRSVQLSV